MVRKTVSSRRPEVEGTERGRNSGDDCRNRGFHRVDPRLRVLKGLSTSRKASRHQEFHRVDPRLRVLKGRNASHPLCYEPRFIA